MRTRYRLIETEAAWVAAFGAPSRYEGPGCYNRSTGHHMDMPQRAEPEAPLVMKDVPEHQMPSGCWVSSRSTQQDEMKRRGWVPYERLSKRPSKLTGEPGYANPHFAKKRGRRVSEASVEFMANHKKEALRKAGWSK